MENKMEVRCYFTQHFVSLLIQQKIARILTPPKIYSSLYHYLATTLEFYDQLFLVHITYLCVFAI